MKALNDKIIEQLRSRHDAWIGKEGQKSRDDFKSGLADAIDTIETLTRDAEFEEVARELMKHLGDGSKYHPHYTVIVTNTRAELVEAKQATAYIEDYIPD